MMPSTRQSSRKLIIEDPIPRLDAAGAKYPSKRTSSSTVVDEEANTLLDLCHPDDPLNNSISLHNEDDELLPDGFYDEQEKMSNFQKFSDTENIKRRSSFSAFLHRNRTTLCASALVCVAVIIIVASVASTLGKQESDSSYKTAQKVPPPPSTLSSACQGTASERSVLNVPETCQEICNKAECCWNPNGNFDCTPETQTNCPGYLESCAGKMKDEAEDEITSQPSLPNEMSVPSPPATLLQDCEKDTSGEVSALCKEECALADCCWNRNTRHICTAASRRTCGAYKTVCYGLNEESYLQTSMELPREDEPKDLPFPPAPLGITLFCDPNFMGDNLAVCMDKCANAECCWKNGLETCAESLPDDACKAYAMACTFWNTRSDYGGTDLQASTSIMVNNGQSNLNNQETADTDTTEGTTDSEITDTTPDQSIVNQNQFAGHSDTDFSTATIIPDAPAELQTTCSLARLFTLEGKDACQNDCSKAQCCWVPVSNEDGIASCRDREGCDGWSPCDVLIGVGDGRGVGVIDPTTTGSTTSTSNTETTNQPEV